MPPSSSAAEVNTSARNAESDSEPRSNQSKGVGNREECVRLLSKVQNIRDEAGGELEVPQFVSSATGAAENLRCCLPFFLGSKASFQWVAVTQCPVVFWMKRSNGELSLEGYI